ncbi:hypothetical protein WN943_004093 [Citrus x changshan-huyou]
MGTAKPSVLPLILLITFIFMSRTQNSVAEARPLSIIPPQQSKKNSMKLLSFIVSLLHL